LLKYPKPARLGQCSRTDGFCKKVTPAVLERTP
jgi:hypothetical protein